MDYLQSRFRGCKLSAKQTTLAAQRLELCGSTNLFTGETVSRPYELGHRTLLLVAVRQ